MIKAKVRVILVQQSEILLMEDIGDHYHFFPGGKMDFGETIQETAAREINEELGDVQFKYLQLGFICEHIIPNTKHNLEFFVYGQIARWNELDNKADPEHPDSEFIRIKSLNNLPEKIYPAEIIPRIRYHEANNTIPNCEHIGRVL